MKKPFLLLIFTTMSLWSKPYTVDELIQMALQNSPDINISRSAYEISQQRYEQASSGYLPTIDLTGTAGVMGIENQTADESGSLISGKITASQLICDFGKTTGSMDAAKNDANATFSIYKQQIADKIFEVKQNYYNVLNTQELIAVHVENVQLNEKQLIRSERYFEAGIRTKIDVSDAKVALTKSKLDLHNALYDLKLAYSVLNKSIGVMHNEDNIEEVYRKKLQLPYIFDTLPAVESDLIENETFAYANRWELKSFTQKIKAAKARLKNRKSDNLPAIYALGSYDHNEPSDDLKLFVPEQEWQATLTLQWNLFSGFKTEAEIEEARISMLQSYSEYDQAKLSIKNETDDAFINLLRNRDSVQLSEEIAVAAKEKFTQAQQRYEHGLSDYIELQQSRQDYIDSLSGLVVAYYTFYTAQAALDRAIGK